MPDSFRRTLRCRETAWPLQWFGSIHKTRAEMEMDRSCACLNAHPRPLTKAVGSLSRARVGVLIRDGMRLLATLAQLPSSSSYRALHRRLSIHSPLGRGQKLTFQNEHADTLAQPADLLLDCCGGYKWWLRLSHQIRLRQTVPIRAGCRIILRRRWPLFCVILAPSCMARLRSRVSAV